MNKNIRTIANAFLLYIDDYKLVVLNRNVGINLYDNNLNLLWGKKDVFGSCYIYGKDYYFSTSERTIHINEFGEIVTEFQFRIINQYNNFFIISRDINDISLFIPEKNNILWSKNLCISNIGLINKNTFFATIFDDLFNIEKCIFNFSLKDNSLIWKFSYEQLYSSNKKTNSTLRFIGIYNNILWLHVEHSRLIALDVKIGELKYQIDLLKEFNFKGNAVDQFVCGDIHLDPSIGVLKSLSNRYYWELDLNTLKVLVKNDFGADQTISWRIKRSRFYEGDKNLYFIGAKNGEGVNRGVGIFDTEKCDVLWYDQPLEEKKFLFFTDAPQANQTQLGVIDSDNTLRIYNKT